MPSFRINWDYLGERVLWFTLGGVVVVVFVSQALRWQGWQRWPPM